jgi:hypothetical protein
LATCHNRGGVAVEHFVKKPLHAHLLHHFLLLCLRPYAPVKLATPPHNTHNHHQNNNNDKYYSLRFKVKGYVFENSWFKVIFCTFNIKVCALSMSAFRRVGGVHSKVENFWQRFHWKFGRRAPKGIKTSLMCVGAVKSKYQSLNEFELLFDLIVHQQQHLHCFGNIFQFIWRGLREISPNVIFIS